MRNLAPMHVGIFVDDAAIGAGAFSTMISSLRSFPPKDWVMRISSRNLRPDSRAYVTPRTRSVTNSASRGAVAVVSAPW